MTTYTNVFGGNTVYPSDVSFRSLELSPETDVDLQWPTETSLNTNIVAAIMEVTPSESGLFLRMPPANQVSSGQPVLFVNKGASSFAVRSTGDNEIVVLASGDLWMIYITDNSTEDGSWEAFKYGATTSTANAASLAGTGLVAIGSRLFQSTPVTNLSSNYTTSSVDRAKIFNWVATGAGIFTLPNSSTVGNNWFVGLINSGGGDLVVPGVLTLQPGDSTYIISGGSSYLTIGLGRNPQFLFDYTSIDVAGSGDYTLETDELNRIVYKFIGELTGDRTILVPETVQQYWINNQTTGDFSLSVAMVGGVDVGVAIQQGERVILYCDGDQVLNADTDGVSIPVTIAQGGTSATTAGQALVNLGGGSTGISIFESENSETVLLSMGAGTVGAEVFQSEGADTALAALDGGAVGVEIFKSVDIDSVWGALDNIVSGGTFGS